MIEVQVEVDGVTVHLPPGEKLSVGDECLISLKYLDQVYVVTGISDENACILMRKGS
jgi:hypothetical protein